MQIRQRQMSADFTYQINSFISITLQHTNELIFTYNCIGSSEITVNLNKQQSGEINTINIAEVGINGFDEDFVTIDWNHQKWVYRNKCHYFFLLCIYGSYYYS